MATAAAVAGALIALLAFAPFASATPDPVASGSTAVTFNKGWTNYLKTFGIKIQKVGNAKIKGQKATFKVTGGEMDPTNGLGTLTLSGGIKFKAGKKSATMNALVLNSGKNWLQGKVAGKKVNIAKLSGLSFSRSGFGVKVNLKKMQLTNGAANQLNKALGMSKGKPKPFLKNKVIGKSNSEDQPKTVTLLPTGSLTVALDPTLASKLSNVKTEVQLLTGTTASGTTYTSPVTGGTFSPLGTEGTIMSAGGLKLVQKLPKSATEFITTEITLGGIWYDLAAKTLTVEVSATSNASKELNLGALGRSSVADVTIGGVIADPNTRSVAVQNSAAALQPVSAEVLNGFVKVYAGYVFEVKKAEGKEAEGKILSEAIIKNNTIAAGNPLGTVSFSGQAQ